MAPGRDRLAGGLLVLAWLGLLSSMGSGLVPDHWAFASVPRFIETIMPWGIGLTVCLGLAAAWAGARRGGLIVVALCLLGAGAIALEHRRLSLPWVPDAAEEVRILFFNVLGTNTANAEAIAHMVIDRDPDIAIFAESAGIRPAKDILAGHYDFAPNCDGSLHCDISVYARQAPERYRFRELSGFRGARLFEGQFRVGDQSLSIFGTHLLKPWFSGFAANDRKELKFWTDRNAGPALMVGDFNAAQWTYTLSDLLESTGFRASRRILGSWPPVAGNWGIPLDHALVRGGVRIVSIEPVGEGLGSNHRGFLVTVRLPQ